MIIRLNIINLAFQHILYDEGLSVILEELSALSEYLLERLYVKQIEKIVNSLINSLNISQLRVFGNSSFLLIKLISIQVHKV